jgi:HSP20 family protein
MDTRVITKAKLGSPSLFNNSEWSDKLFNLPLDEYFNFSRVLNVPAVNVNEADHLYSLSIAAPGLVKKDFKVQVEDGMLTINAEKEEKDEKNGKYNRREYNYASWSRSFTLPDDADDTKIKAEYKNGELNIEIPRTGKKLKNDVKNVIID